MSALKIKKKRKKFELPNKPSALIRIALADLLKSERSKLHKVNMGDWHSDTDNTAKCEVCFAGSVMAQSFSVNSALELGPCDFKRSDSQKFFALDYFREGKLECAVIELMELPHHKRLENLLDSDKLPSKVPVHSYKKDRLLWRKDMYKIVRMLEKVNL